MNCKINETILNYYTFFSKQYAYKQRQAEIGKKNLTLRLNLALSKTLRLNLCYLEIIQK